MKVKVVGGSLMQQARIRYYCEQLVPTAFRKRKLLGFLERKGFSLLATSGSCKGLFSREGIKVYRSHELGWRNYRDKDGKRGFFRADQVAIHELMHGVWSLAFDSGMRQSVYALHAVANSRYFNYPDAVRHPSEWFCDQFPRAFLFKKTCDPALVRFLRDWYFSRCLPNIRLERDEVGR